MWGHGPREIFRNYMLWDCFWGHFCRSSQIPYISMHFQKDGKMNLGCLVAALNCWQWLTRTTGKFSSVWWTCSNEMRSSVTFQSSFFKGLVSLYFRLKSTCSFASRFMLLTLRSPLARALYVVFFDMKSLIEDALRIPLARAPYVVFFDLKPLIDDGNLRYICTASCTKKSLRSPQNAFETM